MVHNLWTKYRGPGITSSPADSNISQQRSCKALLYAEPPRRSCSSGVILLKPDLVMSRFLVWDRGPSWRFRSRNVEVLKRNHVCVWSGVHLTKWSYLSFGHFTWPASFIPKDRSLWTWIRFVILWNWKTTSQHIFSGLFFTKKTSITKNIKILFTVINSLWFVLIPPNRLNDT